jgi:hypothetical protein
VVGFADGVAVAVEGIEDAVWVGGLEILVELGVIYQS